MAGESGGTTSRVLNKLQFDAANTAEALGTAAATDRILVADASDDWKIKYAVAGDLGLSSGITATATEINKLAGVTAGTATASKALVLGASKEIATITSATITTLTSPTVNATDVDAGASGTAGSVDVFPTTAAKGKLRLAAADSTGDTTTTITNAAQSAAAVMTIPDTNGAASFVMTAAAQTIAGIKTFSVMPRIPIGSPVAAAGSIQGDAAALVEGFQVVTGANGTLGVRLPTAVAGAQVMIKGTTAGVLKVWPASGGTINALAQDAAMSLASGVIPATFVAISATQWYTMPLLPS